MASRRHLQKPANTRLAIVHHHLRDRLGSQLRPQCGISRHQPSVKQCEREFDILRIKFAALGERTRHRRDAQTGVPQRLAHAPDRLLHGALRHVSVEQEHQVHIRVGKEFAATVAANGDHRNPGGEDRLGRQKLGPQLEDQRIDRRSPCVDGNHAGGQTVRMRLKLRANGLHLFVV